MKENEAALSRSLSAKFKAAAFDVIRIESHGTGNGIPDMFVQGHGIDMWIELKNDKVQERPAQCDYKHASLLYVSWRPGQVAWALRYYHSHKQNKCTLTVVSLIDCYVIIPMKGPFKDNLVDWESCYVCKSVEPETCMKLIRSVPIKIGTFRENINRIGEHFDVDYDPEVLFNEYCPEWYRYIYDIDDPVNPVIWNFIYDGIFEYFELA